MFCQICTKIVDFTKRDHVLSHRQTKTRQKRLKSKDESNLHQTFIVDTNPDFTRVTEAFLSADIPLYKLENNKLNKLFNYVQVPLPSVRTTRRYVESSGMKRRTKFRKTKKPKK